jgi:formylglycine-generating enzyme required for sulfatase activity
VPDRPAIPADITRQILWESGHRCAVCGTPCPLERAHIVPWHKSKEHKAEDLICLCANCHERADKEKWGEKALRKYKETPWVLRQYGPVPLVSETMQAADSARVHEVLTRDGEGNVVVGQGEAVVSPIQVEALAQAVHELPADTPEEVRHRLGALAQALSEDLVPPADFARRAREYVARQQAGRGPLARAEAEESLYVPLELRFHRAIRAPDDTLFRREEGRTYDDIWTAVEASDPASSPAEPFPALVLLGAPGAGKSTSLRHLGLILLRAVLENPTGHLPLFVSLGDYTGSAPADFLSEQCRRWYGRDDAGALLEAGRLWLLADGLNEMPAADERDYEAGVQAWRRFFQDDFPPGNRALVACRTADYGTGLDLPRLEVEPMDAERIRDFVARRFVDAPQRGEDLWQALVDDRQARGPEHSLYGLACNPFWLVMLVDVYRELDRLPENRAALTQHFVERWLAYEADRLPGQVMTETDRTALQVALDQLAFDVLGAGQNAPQPRSWALSRLPERVDVAGDTVPTDPRQVLSLAESACLLEVRGRAERRVVRFYHQLLLEHFAGRELLRRFRVVTAQGGAGFPHPLDEAALWRIPWEAKWQFVESAWDPLPPPPTTGWEEATVLAAARAALADGDWPRLARAVLPHNPPLAARCLLEAGRLSGEGVRAGVRDHLLAVVRDPAATAGLKPRQRVSLRIACGLALGSLGDPRILERERVVVHPDGRRVRFIEPAWSRAIPAGPFQMGSSREDADAYDDEYSEATNHRPHTVVVPHDYAVGRHPVTNAEYGCFVADGGYDDGRWWDTDEARRWLRGELDLSEPWMRRWKQIAQWVREGAVDLDEWVAQRRMSPQEAELWRWVATLSDEELAEAVREAAGATGAERCQPRYWEDRRYYNPAQPVLGVCWYEARAYCAWLTGQLRIAGLVSPVGRDGQPETWSLGPETIAVRLPTEAEWEKAARWDGSTKRGPHGGRARRYPWGDGWDEARANTLEGRVLTTAPVGVYPEGAASCGALDLAGNVWEWTASRWGPEVERPTFGYPYDPDDGREHAGGTDLRVARGGSWNDGARIARCASRGRNGPGNRSYFLGFRALLQLS